MAASDSRSETRPASGGVRPAFGIGARLIAAFIAIVGLAVAACVVAWLSYVTLSGELAQVARSEMPRLSFATRLSKAGADISSVMPNLANASSRTSYSSIRLVYSERLDALNTVLSEMKAKEMESGEFSPLVEAINRNLSQLDIAAGRRFTLLEEIRANIDELRWVQTDLLSEAEPLVDDARFNIETEIRAQSREPVVLTEQRKSEALMSVVAQASLATGLLARLADIGLPEDMQETLAYLGDSSDELRAGREALADWPDSITVHQLAGRILDNTDIRSGIPNTKRSELAELARVQALALENRRLVEELGNRIAREVRAAEAGAHLASARAEQEIKSGSSLLLAIAVMSVIVALLVGYFYVHRNLIARIRQLAGAASNISAGHPGAVIAATGRDELSELAQALNVFRQTRDELIQSAKLAALGKMAAGIGHELKQPLAAIRAHTHNGALLIGRREDEKALKNLEKIGQLTQRMSDQIGHLRRFARLPETRLGPVELSTVVNEAVGLLAHRFEDEKATLEIVSPKDGPLLVLAEAVRLEQIFVNLIANALDAVAAGEVRKIRIESRRNGDLVETIVGDSGPGIAPGDVGAIFDPFFTTKPPNSGLGLGLSITYNVVKDFDGSIAVLQTSRDGTMFCLTLKSAVQ